MDSIDAIGSIYGEKKRKKKQTAHTTHLELGITVTPRTFGQQDEFSEV
jgi:hypothetical protein